jgi:DNA-binding transcriptional ArsR family regulator
MKTREQAAAACLDALDGALLKALSEPARVAILKQIVQLGRADVGTIAAMFPQDRSVVARHLQVLERAGVLKSHVDGRHTFYELNGQGVLKQLEGLVELFRALSPLCCPT